VVDAAPSHSSGSSFQVTGTPVSNQPPAAVGTIDNRGFRFVLPAHFGRPGVYRFTNSDPVAHDGTIYPLLARLREAIPGLKLNGPLAGRIPNTLNLTFPNVLGESMLIALDLADVEVSMGSACAAGAVEPSHVLLAMGRDRETARSALRVSVGATTTLADVDRLLAVLPEVVAQVRRGAAA